MSIFQRVFNEIKLNKEKRELGKFTCIPWVDMPKLSTVIPGIMKEKISLIAAGTKVGKSQLCDFLYMYQPYKFVNLYPQSSIKLKIFYFSLEISKEQKVRQLIAHLLYNKSISLSPQNMLSLFNNYILPDNLLREIEKLEPDIERFLQTIEFVDNIRNTFGIYKKVRDYMEKNGNYYDKFNNVLNINDSNRHDTELTFKIDHYKPHNEDSYVIVIIDHLSLLNPDKNEGTVHNAINKFSNDYSISLRDRYKCCVVEVQQLVASSQELNYTNRGDLLSEKLKPSVDTLADSKYTAKDVNYMLGLFSPYRFKIPRYEGYDISILKDNYRELSININRDGTGFTNIDLFFDGAASAFKQLPSYKEINYNKL
jgi:hypothetical protein